MIKFCSNHKKTDWSHKQTSGKKIFKINVHDNTFFIFYDIFMTRLVIYENDFLWKPFFQTRAVRLLQSKLLILFKLSRKTLISSEPSIQTQFVSLNKSELNSWNIVVAINFSNKLELFNKSTSNGLIFRLRIFCFCELLKPWMFSFVNFISSRTFTNFVMNSL